MLLGYLLASGVLTPKGPKHLLALHAAGTPVLFAKPQDVLTTARPAGVVDPRDRLIRLEVKVRANHRVNTCFVY